MSTHQSLQISGQQLGGRFQYTTRQEGGMGERQTVYRTIPPSATKRAISASAAQRVSFALRLQLIVSISGRAPSES